jgi:hypothetical protein
VPLDPWILRIRDEQPGSYFLDLKNQYFGVKILKSLMRIRDGNNSDPGSGMEKSRIRDKYPGSATLGTSESGKKYND